MNTSRVKVKKRKIFKRRSSIPELSQEMTFLSDLTVSRKPIVVVADVHVKASPYPVKFTESEVSAVLRKRCRFSADSSETEGRIMLGVSPY